MSQGGDKMAKQNSDSANVMDFFAKMYKGEEHSPDTAFNGFGTVCDVECCGYNGG